VINNRIDIIDYFLSLPDIDINVRLASGYTPLCLAVDLRRSELVEKLLATGKAAIADSIPCALERAIIVRDFDLAKRLLDESHANLDDIGGVSLLDKALEEGNFEAIECVYRAGGRKVAQGHPQVLRNKKLAAMLESALPELLAELTRLDREAREARERAAIMRAQQARPPPPPVDPPAEPAEGNGDDPNDENNGDDPATDPSSGFNEL
jgi:ankyrin repeat protein